MKNTCTRMDFKGKVSSLQIGGGFKLWIPPLRLWGFRLLHLTLPDPVVVGAWIALFALFYTKMDFSRGIIN